MTTRSHNPAYGPGAFALVLALGTILAALAFQYIGGYEPCPLCLMQRWAYYAGVPGLFIGLVLVSSHRYGWAAFVLALVALAFLANAGLGVYQAGAEWKYWPGPDTCSGAASQLGGGGGGGGVLGQIEKTRVIRCDEASWRMLGLSFAGWNVVVSLLIFAGAIQAAFAAAGQRILK